jgi:type IV fimbrial biogenesis protein FimT
MKRFTKHRTDKFGSHSQAGFTLVELIITMAIAAIIMTQAVPAFSTTIKNNRLATETNKLVADINLARSESIKRGVNLIMCSSTNPSAAAPTCADSATWTTGWLVFADDNASGDFEAANDTLIRIGLGQSAGSSIGFISNANTLTYTAQGLTTSAATTVVAICDDRGTSFGRQIQINPTGRPRLVASPIGNCTAPAAA